VVAASSCPLRHVELCPGTLLGVSLFIRGEFKPKVKAMATRAHVHDVGGIVSDVRDKGMEAMEAVGEVRDNVQTAVDRSLKKRPYTTLLLAVGVGFVLGALWAR
jgi:ElaB/YqjD/DUF883 family membrane-anchored ribosome-binding protein